MFCLLPWRQWRYLTEHIIIIPIKLEIRWRRRLVPMHNIFQIRKKFPSGAHAAEWRRDICIYYMRFAIRSAPEQMQIHNVCGERFLMWLNKLKSGRNTKIQTLVVTLARPNALRESCNTKWLPGAQWLLYCYCYYCEPFLVLSFLFLHFFFSCTVAYSQCGYRLHSMLFLLHTYSNCIMISECMTGDCPLLSISTRLDELFLHKKKKECSAVFHDCMALSLLSFTKLPVNNTISYTLVSLYTWRVVLPSYRPSSSLLWTRLRVCILCTRRTSFLKHIARSHFVFARSYFDVFREKNTLNVCN